MGRKEIKPSIIKELYAKGGNLCVFPGCKNKLFTDNEANDVFNLILLYKKHHGYIDQNEEKYTVEVLKNLKKSYEKESEDLFSEKVLNTSIIKDIEKLIVINQLNI